MAPTRIPQSRNEIIPVSSYGNLSIFTSDQINLTTEKFTLIKQRGCYTVYDGFIKVNMGRSVDIIKVVPKKVEPEEVKIQLEMEELQPEGGKIQPEEIQPEGAKIQPEEIQPEIDEIQLEGGQIEPEEVVVEEIEPEEAEKLLVDIHYIGGLKHSNIQCLYGYCIENEHRFLVHESSDFGTLDRHLVIEPKPKLAWLRRLTSCLFAETETNPRTRLTWHRRMMITLQIAKGLEYLHSRNRPLTYYHPIFNTKNVFLDQRQTVKLCDFHIARDGEIINGPREDIYGFGSVMLEIFTGQTAIEKTISRDDLKHEKFLMRLDSSMRGEYTKEIGVSAMSVAYECLNPIPRDRPGNMAVVVKLLEDVIDDEKKAAYRRQAEAAEAVGRMLEYSMLKMRCI